MKNGEIYGVLNIDTHNVIEAVIIQKHIGTDTVVVCPIVKAKNSYIYAVNMNGKQVYFDTRQLYTLKEKDLLSKVGEISDDELKKLSDACVKTICG